MANLYLLRHANAEGIPPSKTDQERTLSDKGIKACQAIINHIQSNDIHPDLVLCSTAERTRQTSEIISRAWPEAVPVEYLDSIYEAHPEDIRLAIADHTADNSSIMVIGHNPGLQMLAMGLSNNQSSSAFLETATRFPAGALAKMAVHPELWDDVEPGKFTYLKLLTP